MTLLTLLIPIILLIAILFPSEKEKLLTFMTNEKTT